eukprot:11466684-Alexandrium_andersonii.AAC.1
MSGTGSGPSNELSWMKCNSIASGLSVHSPMSNGSRARNNNGATTTVLATQFCQTLLLLPPLLQLGTCRGVPG